MKYNVGDIVEFKTGLFGQSEKGTIVEIDYNQICVDCNNSDVWILESDIIKTIYTSTH